VKVGDDLILRRYREEEGGRDCELGRIIRWRVNRSFICERRRRTRAAIPEGSVRGSSLADSLPRGQVGGVAAQHVGTRLERPARCVAAALDLQLGTPNQAPNPGDAADGAFPRALHFLV